MIKINTITLILFTCMIFNLSAQQNWTHKVRIAGNPLSKDVIETIIKNAKESFVFGIEVDNDITGRYESFLDPTEKLEAIRKVTEEAHKINNKTFVYIAGLECITSDADNKKNTFYKDHPDWVQRDINGKPALFGSKDAFWISEGDEDVWISPYAMEWRKIYMQRVREIAATGIDGIYVDILYWMTHFEGWENTWASFDDYTVAAFNEQTGLDPKKDFELGNFNESGFIKWINFRMQTLTDFMSEINKNIKEVNPKCKTIAEIYPGISEEVVRVGADVFQMYDIVDVIAHEYSEGEYYASDRSASDWYNYIIGMHTFRAFAEGKASWMLSYSWADNKNVDPSDAIKSLFVSELFSGTNLWDVKSYVMSSTNDMKTRTEVYKWVAENENIFYSERTQINPISVYFSDNTRNYFSKEFISSYRGILNLLVHSHLPFQIVTSRTIDKLSPDIMIMPNVKCLSNHELESIKMLYKNGTKFLITGESGKYNNNRELQVLNPLEQIFGFSSGDERKSGNNFLYLKTCPGNRYSEIINLNLNKYFNTANYDIKEMSDYRNSFLDDFNKVTPYMPKIQIEAPIDLLATTSISDNNIYIYLTNIKGLCLASERKDKSLKDVTISYDKSLATDEVFELPFLKEKIKLNTIDKDGKFRFTVSEIDKGTVIIINR